MPNDDDLMATLVHISDLHIGDIDASTGNASANKLAAWAVQKFRALDGLLGHQGRSLQDLTRFWKTFPRPSKGLFSLVVTGDYTRCGGLSEFQTVFEYLTSEVNLGTTLSPTRTGLKLPVLPLGIPGNHDQWGGVNFPVSGKSSDFGQSRLANSLPHVFPAMLMPNGRRLVVCGIDSDDDVNRVGLDRLRAIGSFQRQLARLAKTLGPNPGNEVRVLLVHHSWNHQGRILRMTGASKTAMHNFVVAHGIKIVLSGHTHGTKMLPIPSTGRPDAHELCCGTTTQLDHIPYEWSTLMRNVPTRKWPENTLLVHQLRVDGTALKWHAQPWFRDVQNGFQMANYSYIATL